MEEWKVIEESNGKYEISNFGRCRNVKKGTILKENKSFKNVRYNICGNSRYAHRLVALSFLENKENYDLIRHKDGNLDNNRADNLEWHYYNGDKRIGMFNKDDKLLLRFNSCSSAGAFFKSNHTLISLCVNGKRPSAYGYYWKFV